MDSGNAVGAVRPDDGEVGHAAPALVALLDEADAPHAAVVAGEALANFIEETLVYLQDDFEVARRQNLEPLQRPFLQGFGQQRVVRIGKRAPRDIPRLIPAEAGLV